MFHKTFIKTDRACGATTALMNALFEELESTPGLTGLYLAPYGEVSNCVDLVRDRPIVHTSRNTIRLPNQSVLRFAVCREGRPCSTRAIRGINFDIVAFEEYNYLPREAIQCAVAGTILRPNAKLFRTYAFDRTDEEVIVLFREPQNHERWEGAKSSITVRPVEPAFAKERKTILAKHI